MRTSGPHSPSSPGSYTLLGFSGGNSKASSTLDISKAYKFITRKWNHHRKNSSSNKSERAGDHGSKEFSNGKNDGEGTSSNDDTTTSWEDDDPSSSSRHHHHHKYSSSGGDDSRRGASRRTSDLSRSTSRRSQTPTPSSFSRLASRRCNSVADFLSGGFGSPLSRSASRRVGQGQPEPPAEEVTTPATESRSTSSFRTPTRRTMSRVGQWPSDSQESGPNTPTSAASRSASSRTPMRTMSRTASSVRRGSSPTPIVYSQTAARKKPPPMERKLECTLEELLHGCVKKVAIVRDVLSGTGVIQEEETLKINVEPGWRKGTRIMFEGKGDEKPGYLPADMVFVIDEKRHPLFRRRGDDLEIEVEIPLVQALVGCTLPVPLLGGERMALSFEEIIIYPGYEKAIPGQGMPSPKDPARRGELRITFFVEFPSRLSERQRVETRSILVECDHSWTQKCEE